MSTLSPHFWFGRKPGDCNITGKSGKNISNDPDKDAKDLDALVILMRNDCLEDPPLHLILKVIELFSKKTIMRLL